MVQQNYLFLDLYPAKS